MREGRRRALRAYVSAATIGATFALAPALSMAEMTKAQCVDANAKAQDLRREGKLSLAREQLRACTQPSCPAIVRSDCTKRLDELENAQPTIAFEVKSASGADLTEVKVTIDGKPLAEKLGGSAFAVDPGPHRFAFEVAGEAPATRTLVLTEGEKGRRERVTLGATVPPASAPPPTPVPAKPDFPATQPETPSGGRGGGMAGQKILGLVAGGIGVVGLGVGGVFGAMTLSQKSQQQSDCSSGSTCTSSGHALALNDHSTGMADSTISTVGFIAGGVLLAGGAVLLLTGGSSARNTATASPSKARLALHLRSGTSLVPSVGPGGGGMFLRGEF